MRICFDYDNSSKSKKAFLLFSKTNPKLIDGSVFSNTLFSESSNFITERQIPDIILSRFSSLLTYSISNYPKQSREACGLIFQLLQHVSNESVIDFYSSICLFNSPYVDIQQSLKEAEFSLCVVDGISKNTDQSLLPGLFRIIQMSSGNQILGSAFKKPQTALALMKHIENDDPETKKYLWRALTAVISAETAEILAPLFETAVAIVRNVQKSIRMFEIFAFDFIGKIILYAPNIVDRVENSRIIDISIGLIILFPDSSNLVASVFRFYRNISNYPLLTPRLFSELVPMMISIAKGNDRSALTSNCYLYILYLNDSQNQSLKQTLENTIMYKQFYQSSLVPYEHILNTPYGGKIENTPGRSPSLFSLDSN